MSGAPIATVLFVEDEAELRLPVLCSLERSGFRVLTATTGEEALDTLRSRAGQVDWLFTDIRLPGLIDGWRVADEFRFSHPLRPVIFATGAAAERPRDVNESLFLRKPYAVSDVVRAFQLLNASWTACGDAAEALSSIRSLPFGSRLSWGQASRAVSP